MNLRLGLRVLITAKPSGQCHTRRMGDKYEYGRLNLLVMEHADGPRWMGIIEVAKGWSVVWSENATERDLPFLNQLGAQGWLIEDATLVKHSEDAGFMEVPDNWAEGLRGKVPGLGRTLFSQTHFMRRAVTA